MDKKKESFHQTTDDAIKTLQENNLGRDISEQPEKDSVIRNAANKGNEEKEQKEKMEREFYGDVKSNSQENQKARKNAIMKITFLSVLAILVVGLAVAQDSKMPWNIQQQAAEISQKSQTSTTKTDRSAEEEKSKVQAVAQNTTLQQNTQTTEQTPAEESQQTSAEITWQLPVYGEIIKDYGYSYDKTWQDYRFHSGIDIAMEKGEEVYAINQGTVTESSKTKALGEYIRIDYGNNLVGYYFGIDVKDNLTAGTAVSKNQVIGTVTDPPLEESAYEPHYHFGLIQDGQTIDPKKLMK